MRCGTFGPYAAPILYTYLDHKSDDEEHRDAGHDVAMVLNDELVAEDRRVLGRGLLFEGHRGCWLRPTELTCCGAAVRTSGTFRRNGTWHSLACFASFRCARGPLSG
jgi:hypothetical protein